MILFHGSNILIEAIDLAHSKPDKDFGRGFYLFDKEEPALEMARFKAAILGGSPVVTKFIFDKRNLTNPDLKVKIFDGYSEAWADFVFANRHGDPTESYDIVQGPIPHDNFGLQIRRLKNGNIARSEFVDRLQLLKSPACQYFFGSERAVATLIKIK